MVHRVAVLMLAVCFVDDARAHCLGPPAALTFSFPADGAMDVPLNAKIFVVTEAFEVRLDGVALTPLEPPMWDPGPLEPNRVYVVDALILDLIDPPRPPVEVSFSFTTGTATAPPPSAGTVEVVPGDVIPRSTPPCFLENDSDCLDDCAYTTAYLVPAARDVVLWKNDGRGRAYMPATCADAPAIQSCAWDDEPVCGTVVGYGVEGTVLVSEALCASLPSSEGEGEGEGDGDGEGEGEVLDDGGCGATHWSRSAAAEILVVGLMLRRRRR